MCTRREARSITSLLTQSGVPAVVFLLCGVVLCCVSRLMKEPARARAEQALIDVGLALLFLVLPHGIESDGRMRFLALLELLQRHTISPIPYSMVGPLVSTPLYFIDKLFGTPEWWLARFNVIVLAATILPYSGQPEFSYPFFFGVLSILLSFGKGLLFYSPGLLLSLPRTGSAVSQRLKASHTLWLWFLAGLVVVYAKWWAWFGGWVWGPRFFLLASVPASLAIAVRLQRIRESRLPSLVALLAVLTLSVWVGINGAVYDQQDLGVCRSETNEFLCWYVPEFSALWHPFVAGVWPEREGWVIA